jgi:hypothetical protein
MTAEAIVRLLLVALVIAVLLGAWLLNTANRLDRLHVRTDAAWAGLDAALARRAVVVRAVAGAGCVSADGSAALRAAADRAEFAGRVDREAQENDLSRLLAELDRATLPAALAEELADAEHRVVLARRVHNDAVRDTQALRRRRSVRWLRLAGTAAHPHYFEIAEPVVDVAAVAAPRGRAARIMLADPAGRVLLCHADDSWQAPGGDAVDGEDLRATAVRRLWAETGWHASEDRLIGPAWVRRGGDHEDWFFVVRLRQSEVDSLAIAVDHRWWPARELPGQLAGVLPSVLAGTWDGRTRSIM